MKLKKIYASKLYLTSTRKDRIRAAIQDPINVELVQQLSDYLDDDAQEELNKVIEDKHEEAEKIAEEKKSEEQANEPEARDFDNVPDDKNVFSPSYHGGGGPSGDMGDGPDIFDMPEGGEGPEGGGDIPEPASEPDGPVEESTAIYGKVTADTALDDKINEVSADAEVIKGTLNSREDTAGIQRITVDDKELWIYYKDEVNIGDIMVNVIEALNGSGYTYLSFSRLARSNNAIVFDITAVEESIKSIQEIEEEKK